LKRIVEAEVFERPRPDPGRAHVLEQDAGAGKIRLRVRVSLLDAPVAPVRFRLALGKLVVEAR
jgi:hypothetical protein